MTSAPPWRLVPLDGAGLLARRDAVFAVQAAALGEPGFPTAARSFAETLEGHVAREAFRAYGALAGGGAGSGDEVLVGFVYGYASRPGQWWHDIVASALAPKDATTWLADAYEVVELHVLPARQGRGLGTALLAALLDGLPYRTALLSTRTASTDARAFYAARGWLTLRSALRFSEHDQPYEILGHRLPLES